MSLGYGPSVLPLDDHRKFCRASGLPSPRSFPLPYIGRCSGRLRLGCTSTHFIEPASLLESLRTCGTAVRLLLCPSMYSLSCNRRTASYPQCSLTRLCARCVWRFSGCITLAQRVIGCRRYSANYIHTEWSVNINQRRFFFACFFFASRSTE